ncbi:hypothetical protein CTI12_AA041880 [Artemisia annua]|uniref:RRM domain-containing protein n=1 Tax=Artemisia annua TaxID=35608 RepID=A0A2U1QDS5_ARTAN|nr:hypothetical protein CTI12_AA041880 [Artemisia annua]
MGSFKTKEDDVARISTSIYITNFPESISAKELFHSCKVYGHVVDSFIPTKRAKNGKRFGFVRFIKVFNVERLVSNLCMVWINRHKLHANIARFQRDVASGSNVGAKTAGGFRDKKTNVFSSEKENVKGTNVNRGGGDFILLDDSCEVTYDLDSYTMGELKQFSSINNIRVMLANEGFNILNVAYLGGLWVMIELDSANTKSKLLQHVGVASWFNQICNAQADFVSREWVVWVDIEGVPLHAWSYNTFKKIGSKWGEMLDLEESKDTLFARKRICIKTKQEDNILEKFKITIRGKVFVVRAKELFVWTPEFKYITEGMFGMDDNSVSGDVQAGGKADNTTYSDDESDVEGVSETIFGNQDDNTANDHVQEQIGQNAEGSYDPFNIYDLLHKKDAGVTPSEVNTSFTHPPGFTPEKDKNNANEKEQIQKDTVCSQNRSEGLSSRIVADEQQEDHPIMENNNIDIVNNKMGGSILEDLMKQLHELKESDARDSFQKAKIQWAIEGDENSKFFHGVINRKRANLAIRGVMVDGEWVDDPSRIKEVFRTHFATCFQTPNVNRSRLAFEFPKTLNPEQHSARFSSIWSTIIREVYALKNQGIDLISHCKIRIGDGLLTRF